MLFDSSNALDDQKIAFEQNLKKLINLCAELKAQNSSLLSENELLKSRVVHTSTANNPDHLHTKPIPETSPPLNIKSLVTLVETALNDVDVCVQLLEKKSINNHSV